MNSPIKDYSLEILVSAARKMGNHATKKQEKIRTNRKNDGSIVTNSDKECEKIAKEIFANSKYNYPVLGEETTDNEIDENTYWVVDPIDGTQNYADGFPLFTHSLALVKENELYSGCIYCPGTGEMFTAVKGKGTYLNGEKIKVGKSSAREGHFIISGNFVEETSTEKTELASNMPTYWVKIIGGAALSLAYISSGYVDGGIFGYLYPWDFAAGILCITEAGGKVQTISGESSWPEMKNGGLIAWNGSDDTYQSLQKSIDDVKF